MEFLIAYLAFLAYAAIHGFVLFHVSNHDGLSDRAKIRWTYIIFCLPFLGMILYALQLFSRGWQRLDPSYQ